MSGDDRPFGVIGQRHRSDEEYLDRGQVMAWQLDWKFTAVLVEEAHGGCDYDLAGISRYDADGIAAMLVRWPHTFTGLPQGTGQA